MRIFLLFFLFASTLSAQETPSRYRLTTNNGLAGLHGTEAINQGLFTAVSLDRTRALGAKSTLFLGLGLQHANYESGRENLPCEFILGDKILTYTSSETLEFNALSSVLRLGAERRFGKVSLRGVLLPTLRLRDRITFNSNTDFTLSYRPDQFISTKVRPGEEYRWTDDSRRELRYNSPFHLQAAVEADFALGKRYAVGLGLQAGLTKYEVDNVFVEQSVIFNGGNCGIAGCPTLPEYVVSTIDARTVNAYLSFRVNL